MEAGGSRGQANGGKSFSSKGELDARTSMFTTVKVRAQTVQTDIGAVSQSSISD